MTCDCEECCKNCCYSTPFSTLVSVIFTVLGLTGFTIAGFNGVAELNNVSGLQNGTEVNVMAPIIAISVVLTFAPLVLVTIASYCITGYIRDICYHGSVKCCVKSYCLNITIMVGMFLLIVLWLLLSIGLGGVMSYYIQWVITCPAAESPDTCIPYVDQGFSRYLICGQTLEDICPVVMTAGQAFAVSLLFAVFIIIGLVVILVIHATQFVNGRDYLDYRQTQKQDGFFSKNSR